MKNYHTKNVKMRAIGVKGPRVNKLQNYFKVCLNVYNKCYISNLYHTEIQSG